MFVDVASACNKSLETNLLVLISTLLFFQLDFDDVIAEPLSAQGFEPIWRLTYVLFSQTKLWLYKLISAVLAVPAALMWAVVFALVSIVYVWVISPVFKIFDFAVALLKRVSLQS